MGKDFCFYHMLKTIFWQYNKIWEDTKKIWGNFPRIPPCVCGPGQNRR